MKWVAGLVVALGVALLVWLMLGAAWRAAGRPVQSTGEYVAQVSVLLAAVQTVISLVVAGATLAYVRLTNQMVSQGRSDAGERARSDERVAIDSLAGGALTAVAQSVIVARGLRPSIMVRLRGSRRARETILLAAFVRVTDALSEITRAGEAVKTMRPDLVAEVDAVLALATDAFDAAMAGRSADAEAAAPELRSAIDALKGLAAASPRV